MQVLGLRDAWKGGLLLKITQLSVALLFSANERKQVVHLEFSFALAYN